MAQEKWASISKEDLEMHLLDQAQIVFATLITCGRRSLQDMDSVDYLLVDEASQSVEAATLIPLRFQPKKNIVSRRYEAITCHGHLGGIG
ncbi:MAG: hypothetical protein LRY43_01410 [Gammaproteobacteria bacterium]|nr:hypothetical protein [Gammaproteobacteria bacterium]